MPICWFLCLTFKSRSVPGLPLILLTVSLVPSGPAIDESQTLRDRPRRPYAGRYHNHPIMDGQEDTANIAKRL